MGRFAPLVKELASRLRGMEVSNLAYFHTDHFEPWRSIGEAPAIGAEIVDAIGEFCRVTERIDFARRLTLFYKPHLDYALRLGNGLLRADPGDLLGFLPRAEHQERFGRSAMQEVVASSAHDIQLHIHHEYYTATTAHTDPEAVSWFASPLGRALDPQRLELAIRLNREIVARETGRSTTRWFFVHGHWALNASDDSSCTITNEIDILLRSGCRGDFTFPAGRSHTNPRIRVPYLCKPFDEPKGYDFPEAEPEIARGNSAAAATKFFIWAAPATALQCSLDYMSLHSRRQIENTEKAARELIDNSYVADRRLFIKTHAHSMHPYYFEHARMPVFPHQFPATQTLLSVIFDAAVEAGLEVQLLHASEAYDLLISAEKGPEVDLAATFLKSGKPALPKAATARRSGSIEQRASVGRQAATVAPLAPGRALELVRETSAAVLRQRIETLGVRDSGAYGHYSELLRQGFPIPHHELMALDMVRRQVPKLSSYHEIGSGIGILSFLLALNGFPTVGIECDKRRYETAVSIWHELAQKPDTGQPSCRLVFGRFPVAPTKYDTTDALAIFTDFVTTQTADQVQKIVTGLKSYPYVLVDLQRFCQVRKDAEARLKLLHEFAVQGFTPATEIEPSGDSAFVLLRNEIGVRPRLPSALWSRLVAPWRKETNAT